MCGIAGIFLSTPDIELSAYLETMGNFLAHRGPDGKGIYQENHLGLIHTRLSIIDIQHGQQPLYLDDLVLIANGEIYNYLELQESLKKQGCYFKTNSDSEVILHAYKIYQENFIDYLEGMFSFALYDKNKKKLFLARDRTGIKPLYIANLPYGIAFASEIKALIPLLDKKTINLYALSNYLHYQCNSNNFTILENIEKLPAGFIYSYQNGKKIAAKQYFSLENIQTQTINLYEAQEALNDLLKIVIKQHLRSDVPIGLFLSGGVDSSILASLLHQYHNQPIKTYTIGFDYQNQHRNEANIASQLAKHFNLEHQIISPNMHHLMEKFVYSIWLSDELMQDQANLPTLLLAETAHQDNLKVIFSGEGGDEAFLGYKRYQIPFIERLLKNIIAPGTGGYRITSRMYNFSHSFIPELQKVNREVFIKNWQAFPKNWSQLQHMQALDIKTALVDNLLVKLDRMLMGQQIEGRVPFSDHRIISFGLSLLDNLKINKKIGKYIIKHWGQKQVPVDLFLKKQGFHLPSEQYFSQDIIKKLEKILPRQEIIQQYCNIKSLKQIFKNPPQKFNRYLWTLLELSIWHKLFIQNNGQQPNFIENPIDFITS